MSRHDTFSSSELRSLAEEVGPLPPKHRRGWWIDYALNNMKNTVKTVEDWLQMSRGITEAEWTNSWGRPNWDVLQCLIKEDEELIRVHHVAIERVTNLKEGYTDAEFERTFLEVKRSIMLQQAACTALHEILYPDHR